MWDNKCGGPHIPHIPKRGAARVTIREKKFGPFNENLIRSSQGRDMASVKVGVYDVQKAFQPQAFNVFNHANWYVQYGDGINQMQYNRNRYQLRPPN